MPTAIKSLGAAILIVLLLAGVTAVGYARWTRSIADADRSLAEGEWDQALGAYAEAEARFDRVPAVRQLLGPDYTRVVGNQLWLLYRLERYDDLIEKAERSPERAAPHFWSGLAFFAKARAEEKPEAQLGWLTRSEEELRRAVEAEPADWDTKYRLRAGHAARIRAPQAAQDPSQPVDAAAPPAAEARHQACTTRGVSAAAGDR